MLCYAMLGHVAAMQKKIKSHGILPFPTPPQTKERLIDSVWPAAGVGLEGLDCEWLCEKLGFTLLKGTTHPRTKMLNWNGTVQASCLSRIFTKTSWENDSHLLLFMGGSLANILLNAC